MACVQGRFIDPVVPIKSNFMPSSKVGFRCSLFRVDSVRVLQHYSVLDDSQTPLRSLHLSFQKSSIDVVQ